MEIIQLFEDKEYRKMIQKIASLKSSDVAVDFLDTEKHRILDQKHLPDKIVRKGREISKKEHNRITVPYQKLIVNTSVAFTFGNPIKIEHDDEAGEIIEDIKDILHDNKESSLNTKVATRIYGYGKCAELWYNRENGETRVMILSQKENDRIIPIYDEYGDMVLFFRGYKSFNEEGREQEYYTVWSKDLVVELTNKSGVWEIVSEEPNKYGKIPVIYGEQPETEYHDVQSMIERLEMILSKHAEINDYHAAPKVFVKGNLTSMPDAGDAGGVLKGEEGTDVKILSWADATDSVKTEIETLITGIHKFTQTPDVSFENIKGMGQVSGVMLKMLFMDAHLKVVRKTSEIWNEYFTRRYNLLKRMRNIARGIKSDKEKDIKMSPVITPFMIDDIADMVNTLMAANGGLPLITHKQSIIMFGQSDNPEEDYEEIKQDQLEQAQNRATEGFFGII